MSHALGAKLELPEGSWLESAYQVLIGMIVGTCHIPNLLYRWWLSRVFRPMLHAMGQQPSLEEDAVPSEQKLKVVAVGYGRTGTVSGSNLPKRRL